MAFNNFVCFFLIAIIGLLLAMGINAKIDPFNLWRQNRSLPPPKQGLDYTFYDETCPQTEEIVRSRINYFMDQNITQAAGLLRLLHHDCFVKGCDASVLLRGSAGAPWDLSATPDQSLSPEAFAIIDDIKTNLEAVCPQVVSCADIIALAARDAVLAAEGPYFPMPTGRRDSRALDTAENVLNSMPKPTWNVSLLLKNFKSRGLDVVDLVALSGAHTLGQAHCASFVNRLCPLETHMSKNLMKNLLKVCPTVESTNKIALDRKSPEKFDRKYYKNLMKNEGLLTSDEDLFYDARTKELVRVFEDSEFAFFLQFAMSTIKMSQLGVLTGMEGEIRVNCWEPNYIEPIPSPASEPTAFSPSSPAPEPTAFSPSSPAPEPVSFSPSSPPPEPPAFSPSSPPPEPPAFSPSSPTPEPAASSPSSLAPEPASFSPSSPASEPAAFSPSSPTPEPASFSPASPTPYMIPVSSPTPAESATLYSRENELLDVMK